MKRRSVGALCLVHNPGWNFAICSLEIFCARFIQHHKVISVKMQKKFLAPAIIVPRLNINDLQEHTAV